MMLLGERDEADLEFELRAVNAHQQMLDALKAALPCVKALEATQAAVLHDYICTEVVDQVIAAIKKGEE
jgi:hypothetical protein